MMNFFVKNSFCCEVCEVCVVCVGFLVSDVGEVVSIDEDIYIYI